MAASFSITPYWIIKVTPAATRYFSEGKTIRILGFGKCGERKRFEKPEVKGSYLFRDASYAHPW